jgi:hypothetical protein
MTSGRPDPVGPLPLVGLKEIAQRAGLKKTSAVANWRIRYDDFPDTVADLGCGPVFWWPQVERWLQKTGRACVPDVCGTSDDPGR